MGAGVSTDGMRVAGVLVGVDAWVKTFGAKKARSVITDVAKLDVVSDGLLHNQLLHFCENARLAFLGRNTPTQDYGCVEWTSESNRVPAPLAVSIALPFVPPSVGSRNSPPPLSTVTLPQLRTLFQSTH